MSSANIDDMPTTKPLTFSDLRSHIAHHVDTAEERLARLDRAARNCAASVALLERAEEQFALAYTLARAS